MNKISIWSKSLKLKKMIKKMLAAALALGVSATAAFGAEKIKVGIITTLTTPLWIPQLFWLSGLIFFMISLVFVLVWSVSALFRWDLRTVRRVAGVLSVEEEIEVETHGTDVRSGSQGQEN